MYVRVTTYPSTAVREAREKCEESNVAGLPLITAQPGCRGTFVLSDPMGGRVQTLSFWDSEDALIASHGRLRAMSAGIAHAAGLRKDSPQIEIFDLLATDFTGLPTMRLVA